jgi:hypothetical protein
MNITLHTRYRASNQIGSLLKLYKSVYFKADMII